MIDIKRIAISTGGGDAPGLNAVLRSVTLAARNRGWDVVGIRDGFNGLMFPDEYPSGGVVDLSREAVRGISHLGGTIIGSTNGVRAVRPPTASDRPDGSLLNVANTVRGSMARAVNPARCPSLPWENPLSSTVRTNSR